MPPHTTKRTTTNLKKKKKTCQNCQKTKLYGSPTTKELKKKHSSRLVRGAEMGSSGERAHHKAASDRLERVKQVVPHSFTDKLGGRIWEEESLPNPGFQSREIKPQSL